MKTETELMETWCPFVRHTADAIESATNRWGYNEKLQTNPEECRCIGLACSQCVDCGAVVEREDMTGPSGAGQEEILRRQADGWTYQGSRPGKPPYWFRKTDERLVYCGRNTGEALRQEVARTLDCVIDAINRFNPN